MKPVGRRRRRPADEAASQQTEGWTDEEKEARRVALLLKTSLTEVPGLTVRVINTLEGDGVLTVGELMSKKTDELLEMANFGEKTLVEVRDVLKEFGLKPTWRLPARKRRRRRKET